MMLRPFCWYLSPFDLGLLFPWFPLWQPSWKFPWLTFDWCSCKLSSRSLHLFFACLPRDFLSSIWILSRSSSSLCFWSLALLYSSKILSILCLERKPTLLYKISKCIWITSGFLVILMWSSRFKGSFLRVK